MGRAKGVIVLTFDNLILHPTSEGYICAQIYSLEKAAKVITLAYFILHCRCCRCSDVQCGEWNLLPGLSISHI